MNRLTLAVLSLVPVLLVACGSDSKPPAGKICLTNSECNNPLSCTFGRCHEACKETRDCPLGQRCVKSAGGNVCQLELEKVCTGAPTDCRAPLLCAADLQCRNTCSTDIDCTLGQKCAKGAETIGSCAEPTELGPDNKLIIGARLDAGTPPVTADAGADAATSASDVGVDVPPAVGLGPCGVPESEPNDTRDTATVISNAATLPSCLGTAMDVDYYELTAPMDPAGGYYQISIGNVGDFEPDLVAFAVSDNGMIDRLYADSNGQDLNAFLAAAPGQKYRLVVSSFASGVHPAKYTLRVTYTKIEDMFEPNDTIDMAKPITLGTPITAAMFEGHRKARVESDDVQDWYSVMIGPGMITAKVEGVPSNVSVYLELVDPTGAKEYQIGPDPGADATLTVMVMTPGAYRIGVKPFAISPDGFGRQTIPGMLPANYTKAYKLTVSQ